MMRFLTIISFLFLLNACQAPYKSIRIDILEPATIDIPSVYQHALIYNKVKPLNASFIGTYYGKNNYPIYLPPKQLSSIDCIKGLTDVLTESPRFQSFVPVIPAHEIRLLPHPDWQKLQKLCSDYNSQIIICLASFDQQITERITNYPETKYHDYDTNAIMEYRIQLIAGSHWLILDPFARKIIDSTSITYMEPYIYTHEDVGSAIGCFHDSLDWFRDNAYYMGMEFGQRIAPKWQTIDRIYYAKGNKEMEKAASLANENKWTEAAEIWLKIYESGNEKLADKEAFNLALAYEIQNLLWKARLWALRSYRISGSLEARNYVNKLYERTQVEKILDKQMGFD